MKAKELMIGDWVCIEGPNCYQIDEIRKEFDEYRLYLKDTAVFATESEIEPIPLTAEILEKNGWEKEFDKKPYMTFYHLEDEKYWLMWCISEHTLDIQRQNRTLLDQYNLCAERVVIACDYVHRLQHALRLCGIDKEIVL